MDFTRSATAIAPTNEAIRASAPCQLEINRKQLTLFTTDLSFNTAAYPMNDSSQFLPQPLLYESVQIREKVYRTRIFAKKVVIPNRLHFRNSTSRCSLRMISTTTLHWSARMRNKYYKSYPHVIILQRIPISLIIPFHSVPSFVFIEPKW